MSSSAAALPICSTCKGFGYTGKWYNNHSDLTPTPNQLLASASRCLLCAAIWHGIQEFPNAEQFLADPRPIDLRLGLSIGVGLRVQYGRPEPGERHLSPQFSLLFPSIPNTEVVSTGNKVREIEGLAMIPRLRLVHPLPFSSSTLSAVRDQIQQCIDKHQHKRAHKGRFVPNRLVDLSPLRSNNLDAVLIDDTSGVTDPYLALSHCWGGLIPYRTLQSNKAELCQRIEHARLPRNFQDAFAVARVLSYRYIWIDSFCIIQDDMQDWRQQAAMMADVYSGAELTISAARSSSHNEGFLTERRTDIPLALANRLPSGTTIYARDSRGLETAHQGINGQPSNDTPLFQRAWAFQERLLSQRILHFLHTEIIFECEAGIWCECGEQDTYPDSTHDKKAYHSSSWQKLIEQYTARGLTYATDVLPAVSAMARDRGLAKWSSRYIAGLMADDIFSNLLWRVKAQRDLEGELIAVPKPPKRPREYTAPSFSWASVIAGVEWVEPLAGYQVVCELEGSAMTLEDAANPLGRVTDGHIVLRGPVVEVKLRSMPKVVEGLLRGWLHPKDKRDFTRRDVRVIFDTLSDIPSQNTVLKLITLREESSWYFRNNGLVLKPSTRIRGAYERVGCYWEADKTFFKDATSQVITIV